MSKPYLLALDLGTSSIGYALFDLDDKERPEALRDVGIRVFPDGRDPKNGEPLAVGRRMARGIRRNRDRGQNRVRRLVAELIACGLLPDDDEKRREIFNDTDPYEARARAVGGEVDAYTLGRALFHIGRRRGFKSNRLASESDESDYKNKITGLREELGEQTLGQYLHARNEENRLLRDKGMPIRQRVVRFRNGETEHYADRQMYADEWDRIRDTQGNKLLTDQQWDMLHETAFFQYPLKPVPKGKCRFYPEEARASVALPIAQRFRIYQEVNSLRYESQGDSYSLDERQRRGLYEYLDTNKSISFKSIPKKLKDEHKSPLFPSDAQFNLDVGSRDNTLYGNGVMYDLRKPQYLGGLADSLDESKVNDLIAFLIDPVKLDGGGREVVMEADEVEAGIRERLPQLTDEQVRALGERRFKRDTMAVSRKFMEQINPVLKETGLVFSGAVEVLGQRLGTDLHHSHFRHEEHGRLPYYGEVLVDSVWGDHLEADSNKRPEDRDNNAFEYGKIANPTVHVALNQLRMVVNRIIDKQGSKPAKIHVELTRDLKNSKKAREEIQKRINSDRKNRERIRKDLEELGIDRPSRNDVQKYMLWEELGKEGARCTVFTGKTISARQLFNGEVEVEHIIPFSRCYDDSMVNKTLAFKSENNTKGNRIPDDVHEFDHAAMQKRALSAFGQGAKYDRFLRGAFEKFYGESGERTMLERELNDTRYISRVAARYLACLFPDDVNRVVSINGRMTAVLRDVWQLNHFKSKEEGNYREDHRHHLVDAFVVGLISRQLVQQLSARRSLNRQTEDSLYRFLKSRVEDIPKLRAQLFELQERVVASYKPDHGHNGSMFNETAYGLIREGDQTYGFIRKPVSKLSFKEVFQVCDQVHMQQLISHLTGGVGAEGRKDLQKLLTEKQLSSGLASFTEKTGIKKLRIRVPNNSIKAIASAPYKGYSKNSYAWCDIWMVPGTKDKKTGRWKCKYEGVYIAYADIRDYKANPDGYRPHPAAKRLMRLYKEDNIRLIDRETGEAQIMRVAGYSAGLNTLDIQPNLNANPPKQNFKSINAIFSSNKVEKVRM